MYTYSYCLETQQYDRLYRRTEVVSPLLTNSYQYPFSDLKTNSFMLGNRGNGTHLKNMLLSHIYTISLRVFRVSININMEGYTFLRRQFNKIVVLTLL